MQRILGVAVTTLVVTSAAWAAMPPKMGEMAADFSLQTLDNKEVKLSDLTKKGPVAVIVLRGYPGYQCPACNQQVGSLLGRANDFAAADANVVLIYPGAASDLTSHAEEFATGKTFPPHFHFVVDPGYGFTNAYKIRWDAPNETAYPTTFVVNQKGEVTFTKMSTTHGGRTNAAEVLEAVKAAKN